MGAEALATPLLKKALARALEIESEQVTLLKRIERKVDRLLGAAYEEGAEHLQLAIRSGNGPRVTQEEATKARDLFIRAHSQLTDDPHKCSLASLQLVTTNLVLGESGAEVQRWARRAHEEAIEATVARRKQIQKEVGRKTLTGEDRISVAGGLGVFGALAICALGIGFLFVIPALGGATLLGGLLIAGFALGGAGNAHEALMKGVEQHIAEPMKRKQLATVEPLRQYVAELAELRHALGTPAGQIASLPG